MTNCLDISVSAFRDAWSPDNPVIVPLMSWLTCDEYRTEVEAIRAEPDKKERAKMKKKLPAITPGGIFTRHAAAALVLHSGLLQFDVDYVEDPQALKRELANIINIAYCGLSVSGRGVWGLIPITSPAEHARHFKALARDFAKYGITADSACQDVCRLRFMSYDPDPYINRSAKPYSRIYKPTPPAPPKYPRPTDASSTRENVEKIISLLSMHKIDITADYAEEWFPLAAALAVEFGEAGRNYFHEISRLNANYHPQETDHLYDQVVKKRYEKFSIGTLFHIAKNYGVQYHERV